MEKYLINPNQKISRISKNIYGVFSEHLGRCISYQTKRSFDRTRKRVPRCSARAPLRMTV